jgi:hypothetical protein
MLPHLNLQLSRRPTNPTPPSLQRSSGLPVSAKELDAAFGSQSDDEFGPLQSLLPPEDSFSRQSSLPPEEDSRGRSDIRLPAKLHNRKESSVGRITNRFIDYELDPHKIDPDLTDKSTNTGKKVEHVCSVDARVPIVNLVAVPLGIVTSIGEGILENRRKTSNEQNLGKNPDKPYAITEREYFHLTEILDYLKKTNQASKRALMTGKFDSSDKVFRFAFHNGVSEEQPVLIVRTKDRDEARFLSEKADQCFLKNWKC